MALLSVLIFGAAALWLTPRPGICADCASPDRPEHVLIIGIDGLMASAVGPHTTPNIAALAAAGAASFTAEAVVPTMSAPNWASLLMGAGPKDHGIDRNAWRPDRWAGVAHCGRPPGTGWPTLFHAVEGARPDLRTTILHNWVGILRFVEAGVADLRVFTYSTPRTVRRAVQALRQGVPGLTFVHLDHVDAAGHRSGWGSTDYFDAVARADRHVGRMIGALRAAGTLDRTVVHVVSDHGGTGRRHGGLTRAERRIPWILTGPGVRSGTRIAGQVSIRDTAPTLAALLNVPAPECWTGRAVVEALVLPE